MAFAEQTSAWKTAKQWHLQKEYSYYDKAWRVHTLSKERQDITDFDWLVANKAFLQKKYPNKHVAIIDLNVIGIGNTALEAFREARRVYPKRRPLLSYLGSSDV